MNQPPHRGSGYLVIAVFALIGAVVGLLLFMLVVDPAVFFFSVARPILPGGNATLEVVFFGRVRYLRIAPETPAFHLEVVFWEMAPPILMVLVGAVGGGLIGFLADRWSRRARGRIGA